jgi:hypothetical protein
MTSDDLETIALRAAVVDGVRRDDDFEVVWRGLPIGRILKQPDNPHWWWGCNVYGQPATQGDRGPAINFKDCQVRFKLAWAKIRPTLTEEAIAVAARHAETLQPKGPTAAGQAAQEALQVLENKRAALRQRVLKSASIASPLGIPETFNLVISGDHSSRPCQVAWRKDKRIGVAFT